MGKKTNWLWSNSHTYISYLEYNLYISKFKMHATYDPAILLLGTYTGGTSAPLALRYIRDVKVALLLEADPWNNPNVLQFIPSIIKTSLEGHTKNCQQGRLERGTREQEIRMYLLFSHYIFILLNFLKNAYQKNNPLKQKF